MNHGLNKTEHVKGLTLTSSSNIELPISLSRVNTDSVVKGVRYVHLTYVIYRHAGWPV